MVTSALSSMCGEVRWRRPGRALRPYQGPWSDRIVGGVGDLPRMAPEPSPRLDLYWIPLGAGARVVRTCGKGYEALVARLQHRPPCDLYHAALVAHTAVGRYSIEITPVPDDVGREQRGVVGDGPVGSRVLGRFRLFRYELRRWRDGVIPDLDFAVASPVLISEDAETVGHALELVALVPTPVWGRDELRAGEMWNSNSVISWVLDRAGVIERAGFPPGGGRAPGWDAGIVVARRPAGSASGERERVLST